ncbi:MAG: hypothetical protein A2096_13735 [Spirochaetes bacterium GWF1_41_5]|nr:MAG: hypothetical protein A2096_13735 [Spirochaetes bacterium GWF1_41_5]HBE03071.1 DNA recombination protein RmuC [Spirochaetia bacterium]
MHIFTALILLLFTNAFTFLIISLLNSAKNTYLLKENIRLKEIEKDRERLLLLNTALQKENENLGFRVSEEARKNEERSRQMEDRFRLIAETVLEEKGKKLDEASRKGLESLILPLRDKISDFRIRIDQVHDQEAKERTALTEQIRQLTSLNQQVTAEASRLTTALKGDSKTQGNYGEMILEKILELSGLEKDVMFRMQPSYTSPGGSRLQPDAVVDLPNNQHLVIDAKVSLTAFMEWCGAETDEKRESCMKQHIISLNKHIEELAGKEYQNLEEIISIGTVIMFIPNEPALGMALRYDPELYTRAFSKKVTIVTPASLFTVLKVAHDFWRREKQSKYSEEIAKKAGDMYDKFAAFVEDLADIGSKIDASKNSYESAFNKLSAGKGNLISRAEAIRKLGARASKELPREIIEEDLL